MLEVSDVCPSCGQVHTKPQFGFKHRAPRECPLVVVGSFPVVSLPSPPPESPVRVPSVRGSRGPAHPISAVPVSSEPIPILRLDPESGRSRGLGIPWLPPPDLGEAV